MEAKEIMDLIVGILACFGLLVCAAAALYCMYSMVVTDRQLKRYLKRIDDESAKTEKEE